jgi:tetratricopeptide (TPR) repeat protein
MILAARARLEEEIMRMQTPEEQESKQKQIKRTKNQKRRIKMTKNKFDSLLNKYRELVSTDSAKARKCIMQLDYKNNFYLLKCIAQTYLDESLFDDGSNKMRKDVNLRKWRMAEKYIIKAFKIDNDNAETLYTMGKIRKVGHQKDIAIYCFKRIIKLGVTRIAKQEYSRGKDFAKMLINDARFELYRIHFYTDPKKSAKYLKEFKANLKKGVETVFDPLNKFLL